MRRLLLLSVIALPCFALPAQAAENSACAGLPGYDALKSAVKAAQAEKNGGLGNHMWATVVNRSGAVCAVAYSGAMVGDQWPGSRVISAQKANTANSFSLPTMAFSTANLYAGTQPGGFLYGLENSNPVDVALAYKGDAAAYGTMSDPMVGGRIGGVNVFGGGLALYNEAGELLGGLGLSGDTSCADNNIAWKIRHALKLDYVPAGIASDKSDRIIYDISLTGKSASGFGHPTCGGDEDDIADDLPEVAQKGKSAE